MDRLSQLCAKSRLSGRERLERWPEATACCAAAISARLQVVCPPVIARM